ILTTENGNVCIDAKKAIELKVGSNTINISSEGIAVNGSLISIQSKGKVDLGGEGPTTIKGKTIEIG
ncbi:type VI secretion system tip protein VgrG, partial [Enterobacter asburiae]|nr:type VI secretion system tip protein VgrG [Enterobacter asburiae]